MNRKTHTMKVTHKQIISGMTTAGALSILLSRFILWVNAESVERELQQELVRVDDEREAALVEVKYLRGLLAERYEGEWKVTKDGRKRYRKVATKVLANRWRTESETLPIGVSNAPKRRMTVLMDIDWSTLEERHSDYNEEEASAYWDKVGNAEPAE